MTALPKLLTGSTGSLGAHILAQLLQAPHIRQIYCLVRADDPITARSRVLSSLLVRGLVEPAIIESIRLTALPSDLSRHDLGLPAEVLHVLQSTVTTVIHSAWAVNFNMNVTSFESHYISGTRNLLDLCLKVPFQKPARFAFVSSVAAASGVPLPARVVETFVEDPSHAQNMGYARSKWVAEHIVRNAAEKTGMNARVLRSGQIVGDSRHGLWNPTEAIPLMIRSATTLYALPALKESPSWIPVDVCARATIELSQAMVPFNCPENTPLDNSEVVYHVLNPRSFNWTTELLPALAAAGLEFEVVTQREWVKRLREGDQDPVRNPTIKLLEFFSEKYDNDRLGREGLVFETNRTEQRSTAIASRYDVIESGLMTRCVEKWLSEWQKGAENGNSR
jgi:thioester reductase-like protein